MAAQKLRCSSVRMADEPGGAPSNSPDASGGAPSNSPENAEGGQAADLAKLIREVVSQEVGAVRSEFAKHTEAFENFRNQTTRHLRSAKGKDGDPQSKDGGDQADPRSEIETLRRELESEREARIAERKRVALAEVFDHGDVRGAFADGAQGLVRELLGPKVKFNSANEPVVDDGQRLIPLLDAVKQYAGLSFLRAPSGRGGLGHDGQGTKARAKPEQEIDWLNASPDDVAAYKRRMNRG